MSGMSAEMKEKIDGLLSRVKEPETGRSVAELNLVARVRYSEKERAMQIFTAIGTARSTCMVCSIVTEQLRSTIERDLLEEARKTFPELAIEIVS